MNYYKQGDAANADKIKAAFERLGLNVCGHRFMDESTLYYTHPEYGYVLYVKCGNGLDTIIKTHPDYKELELSVEPKFKVGQTIWPTAESHLPGVKVDVIGIDTDRQHYVIKQKGYAESALPFKFQDNYCVFSESKPHYDITNFSAGMPVLVRDDESQEWRYVQFSHCTSGYGFFKFCTGAATWKQCIPFNDKTEHLLGTADMCPEEYINW